MWKDFFYYSKSERRSILVLSGIGILLLSLGTWTHLRPVDDIPEVDSLRLDSFHVHLYQKRHFRDSLSSLAWKRRSRSSVVLTDFDPNVADSSLLAQLGLPPFLTKRILNYRAKGGVFRKPVDFSRIYGLTAKQYETLKPFIVIDTLRLPKRENHTGKPLLASQQGNRSLSVSGNHSSALLDSAHHHHEKYPEGTLLDLNMVDTLQLKRVPGIGSGLAKMIIAYRNRLGGYSSVKQLQEIEYLDTTLHKWFHIQTGVYRPLRINRAGLDQLRNHPYMNFYKAKAILEYRRKRGKIKGLPQLSMFQEFTEKDLQRLQPYLDFN